MNPLHWVLRWINLHPVWRLPRTVVWGNRLRAPTFDRWLALALHRARLMGVADHAFLSREIRPGMTVVDIGANQGLYSLLFADLVGEAGRVLAFEPDDMLCTALRDNVAQNEAANVEIYPLALGSAPGTMTLYRGLLNSGDNRLAQKAGEAASREAVRIRIERLDKVLAGRRVDFIKMDVQGWEMEVLRGMQAVLDDPRNARLAIYFEYWPQGLRDAGGSPQDPLTFLSRQGFVLHRTEGGQRGPLVNAESDLSKGLKDNAYINLFATRF